MYEMSFYARPDIAPQLAQVIHRPYRVGKSGNALLTHAGRAILVEHGHSGRVSVVFGHFHNGVERRVEQLGGFFVTRRLPFFRPVFHRKHEAQRPHLAIGR